MKKKNIVISLAMHKGGSGKSSSLANLAYALSAMGFRILAIDTDPQMNLTRCFNLYPDRDVPLEQRKNFYNAFMNEDDIRKHILKTSYENIDFVMSDVALSMIEVKMAQMPMREFRAKDILTPLIESEEGAYDFILIDQNPSLGLFNTSLLHASNEVLVPLEPSIWGIEGLQMFLSYVDGIQKYNKRFNFQDVNILGVLFNKVDRRENVSKDAKKLVDEIFPGRILASYIPTDANIKNAQWDGVPLHVYNKRSTAVAHYDQLAKEVVEIVKKRYE